MEIKQVGFEQIAEVRSLVGAVFLEFEAPEYSEQGVKEFFDTALNNDDFMKSLKMFGAYEDGKLVGIIATRSKGSHIALFFVHKAYHGHGIGKRLFEAIKAERGADSITVNSSPYAREIYHHLGFVDTGAEQTTNGIRFIPMIYAKETNNNG